MLQIAIYNDVTVIHDELFITFHILMIPCKENNNIHKIYIINSFPLSI